MTEQLKPMNEAPKDGTEIVVVGPDSDKPYAAIWSENFRTWQTSHAWFDADEPIGWLPLIQAIPPTHRVVSVEFLRMACDSLEEWDIDCEEVRAIIDNKEQK